MKYLARVIYYGFWIPAIVIMVLAIGAMFYTCVAFVISALANTRVKQLEMIAIVLVMCAIIAVGGAILKWAERNK